MFGAQLNVCINTQAALAILGDLSTGLTAAGTTQATALALVATTNVFTTVGAGAGGRLPVCGINDRIVVANHGANALMVYPPSGGALSANTANVGAMLPPKKAAEFVSIDGTNYVALLSA